MDIRDLMVQALIQGFIPNPYLWQRMVQGQGIQAFNPANPTPSVTNAGVPPAPGDPSAATTAQSILGPVASRTAGQIGGLTNLGSFGNIDQLIGAAGTFLSTGQNIANRNIPGLIGNAASLGGRGLGLAGGQLAGLAPYLSALGGLVPLATGIAQKDPAAAVGAIPGLVGGAGSILSSIGAAQAATIPVAAEGGFGGAAGAGLIDLGAGLSSGAVALPVAMWTMALQDALNTPKERQAAETNAIRGAFGPAWQNLTQAPGAAQTVAEGNLAPGGGGVDPTSAVQTAETSLQSLGDVSHFLGTSGGKSPYYKGSDVTPYSSQAPTLTADALIAELLGSQQLAQQGKPQPANTNVFAAPFGNYVPTDNATLVAGGFQPQPDTGVTSQGFVPGQALEILAQAGGVPTAPTGTTSTQGDNQWYFPSLQAPNAAPSFTPASGNFPGTPDPTFLPDIEKQLAGVTPSNEFDSLLNIVKNAAGPNFSGSPLGTELSSLMSLNFPGSTTSGSSPVTSTSSPGGSGGGGGSTGLPTQPFSTSAGAQVSKQQIDSSPGALANPLNTSPGDSLDKVLAASKAFIGSA